MRPYRFRIRWSSKRLNVTRLGTGPAAALRAAARLSLGSASSDIELMERLLSCHLEDMIAPTGHGCKRAMARAPDFARDRLSLGPFQPETRRHGIVSGIIILPYFCPATALLDCENKALRWPGPFDSGFLSPQPPGVVGIGPVRSKFIPILGQRELVLFLLGGARFHRLSFRGARANPESREAKADFSEAT